MGGEDYRPGNEKGIWYELVSLRAIISHKEASGKDATSERKLYLSWLKDAEYSEADKTNQRQGFYGHLSGMADGQGGISTMQPQGIAPTPTNTPSDFDVSGIMQHQKRGRPPKEGQVHRTTAWRRQKAVIQGVLL
ncbi:hypothetical protein ACFLVN_04150 [Chloroflexota bacterium]